MLAMVSLYKDALSVVRISRRNARRRPDISQVNLVVLVSIFAVAAWHSKLVVSLAEC